eukprot:933953-Rhodomonas_salina.4
MAELSEALGSSLLACYAMSACYAVSGTDTAYGATSHAQACGPGQKLLISAYAMPSTDLEYAATSGPTAALYPARAAVLPYSPATRSPSAPFAYMCCAVLSERMLLAGGRGGQLQPPKTGTKPRACYAMSSADPVYGAARLLCDVRYWHSEWRYQLMRVLGDVRY